MRFLNDQIMSLTSSSLNANGSGIDSSFILYGSVQAVATGSVVGTLKVQMSNDKPAAYNLVADYPPTNWTDVSGLTVNISGSGAYLIPKFDVSYQWIRCVWTSTATGAQTITTTADTGVYQQTGIDCVADVASSLNSTYFIISAINSSTLVTDNFYVWFNVDGAGVDPAVPGKTGVEVDISAGDSANTVAAAVEAALSALTDDFTTSVLANTVTVTGVIEGPVPLANNGTVGPGFTYGITPGVVSNLNSTYFLLNSANAGTAYYVWLNVDGDGVDPAVAGRTGVPVAINGGDNANAVADAVAAAIDALANFVAPNPAANVITVTNSVSGPYTPMTNVNTGFSFAVTVGGGALVANLKTIGN